MYVCFNTFIYGRLNREHLPNKHRVLGGKEPPFGKYRFATKLFVMLFYAYKTKLDRPPTVYKAASFGIKQSPFFASPTCGLTFESPIVSLHNKSRLFGVIKLQPSLPSFDYFRLPSLALPQRHVLAPEHRPST